MGRIREERAFWVYQIHSTLLNPIGAAILQSRVCEQAVRAGMPGSIQEIRRLQEILARLEATTRTLAASHPPGPAALAREVQRFVEEFRVEHPQIEVILTAHGADYQVQRRAGSAVMVVLREALVNAAQHAHPARVDIDLTIEARSILVRVRDNGSGFDAPPQSTVAGSSNGMRWGMRLMREYADMAGGRVEFGSVRGRGTQVTLYVPLEPAPELPQGLRPV